MAKKAHPGRTVEQLEEARHANEELQTVNEGLTTANQALQSLIDSTDIGTIFLDRALCVKHSTPRARDVFNLVPADVGRKLSDITTRILDDPLDDDVRQVLERRQVIEREVQTREGLWFLMRMLPYHATGDRIDGVVITFQDNTVRHAAEELARADTRALLTRVVTAQEDERARIARDLHDQLGQQLTALRLLLERHGAACTPSGAKDVQIALDLARTIDAEVDCLAWELRPATLDDLGLAAALPKFVGEWSARYGIRTDFHGPSSLGGSLSPAAETAFYRVAQEALNNIVKHAHATRVDVLLQARDGGLVLVVEDDGVGFDGADIGRKGIGLAGLHERAALIGAILVVESEPGRGTTVFLRLGAEREPGHGSH